MDIWGDCGKRAKCPKFHNDACKSEIERTYFFFFAFENSICKDYVTEKLWSRLSHNIIPVVLNRKIVMDAFPDFPSDAFIAADDFSNISEFSEYLIRVQNDITLYRR